MAGLRPLIQVFPFSNSFPRPLAAELMESSWDLNRLPDGLLVSQVLTLHFTMQCWPLLHAFNLAFIIKVFNFRKIKYPFIDYSFYGLCFWWQVQNCFCLLPNPEGLFVCFVLVICNHQFYGFRFHISVSDPFWIFLLYEVEV